MPPFAKDVAPMFEEALKAFAADYGAVAAIHAHGVLAKAGVDEEHLRPLFDAAAGASETRSGVAKFALHGATQTARVVDSTPALARAIALRQGDKDLGFKDAGVGGAKLTPPTLRPDVDAAKVGTAAALGDILGADFRAKDGRDPPAAEVNGRTLRFAAEDGRVIAFKFMKEDEAPGKLQREQGSRMSLADDKLEHVVVVPGGLLAPAA